MSTTKAGVGAITIVTAVIGGVAIAGTAASAAFAGANQLVTGPTSTSAGVADVTALNLSVDAADVRVEFYDGAEARLESDSGDLDGWRLYRDGDELKVRSPDRGWSWFLPDWFQDSETVTLLLPDSLSGIDAEFDVQAGALRVDGEFDELDATVNAGALNLDGSAKTVDAEVNAGRADIALADVREAEFTVAAGRLTADLSAVPREVSLDVSAGELTLTVPDDVYSIRRNVSAGDLNSDLQESSSSSNRIDASVSAGTANLRVGD
ncbi:MULTISPECIES: DUF4097 family beta strand repeat-containing protein [unclassified Microbacterium]|uniref:DUF4097 family beta strand repeat-containing protein n=1 Tax=unclassified Microbacterium TaxID=2609290 RepID=UPI0012F7AED0|nr:DUF4097 family beta strand repeat-containing protein [Microbacterium sp. MAH-37]MVQ44058.1 DUF4097 family beta strand repeat protein [Microbacterium sp. MAH-37]